MDSVGICVLGLRSSWWHSRQANDDVASEQKKTFKENHDHRSVSVVNTYVPILGSLDACGGR